jgi:hypothetical protein
MGKPKETTAVEDNSASAATAAMMAINPVGTKAWLDMTSEGRRFIMKRLQQDLETQEAMLKCKNPMELLEVQSEYIKTAMEQYTDEVTRLCNAMFRATKETADDTRSGRARGYDDVPL